MVNKEHLTFLYFIIYILILCIWAIIIPYQRFNPYTQNLIFLIGFVGIWRYSWLLLNVIRAWIYKKKVFKKLRQDEERAGEEIDPEHVFLLVTTFRIGTHVSAEVYRSVVQEAINSKYDTTIIASIVEVSEEKLIREIFFSFNPPINIKLVISRIKGTGKRDALSVGYRVVANAQVDLYNSVVAVIDGDSIMPKNLIKKCARLFKLSPKLGALTTDEDARLIGDDYITSIYRRWYKLRFAQRNISMCSMALSNKILTLTGRMSMIKAHLVANKDFIETVQKDYISHWRLGEFNFLTGDDKSSWYYLAKNGWDMIYVTDVEVKTIEEIPNKNFFIGSLMLMQRWFGNQYRTNERALKLPRKLLGTFPWYALWDQRFTMLTTPFGLLIAFFGSIHWGTEILFAYFWWIMLTRLLMVFIYKFSRKEILPSWIFFLYYNQVIGSFTKMYIWNHLYKQSWTRQKTSLKSSDQFVQWYYQTSSNGSLLIALLSFTIIINFFVANITADDLWEFMNGY